jgi:hypothetical protein
MRIEKANKRDKKRHKERYAPTRERWITHVQNAIIKRGGKNEAGKGKSVDKD